MRHARDYWHAGARLQRRDQFQRAKSAARYQQRIGGWRGLAHACREGQQILLRHLFDIRHGLDAHAGDNQRFEPVFAQKGAQPIVHRIVVSGGAGHASGPDGLERIDDAVAHGGGPEARGLGHHLAQLLVVGLAFVERE